MCWCDSCTSRIAPFILSIGEISVLITPSIVAASSSAIGNLFAQKGKPTTILKLPLSPAQTNRDQTNTKGAKKKKKTQSNQP